MKPWFARKKPKKSNPKKKDETAVLIGKLDTEFSTFIRIRDSNSNGYGKCITCNHFAHWTEMQCGHFMSRRHMATRFDEKNCSMQCGGCNGLKGGMQFDHSLALDQKWGPGTAMRMKVLSLTTRQWFPFELKAAISYYKNEIKRLKEEKGFA
jgi:hypothetical protein